MGRNTTGLLAGCNYGVMKQHVSAYSEAIIRFINVSYRRPITMRGTWRVLRSHHLCLIKHMGEKSARGRVLKLW